uniref:(northern house mosquito) hypothetical protein n=1 Tax=Culex pipiens TaxID=7175 RepID=A0A8D8IMA0_CULPI
MAGVSDALHDALRGHLRHAGDPAASLPARNHHERPVGCPVGKGRPARHGSVLRLHPRLVGSSVGQAGPEHLLRRLSLPGRPAGTVRYDWGQTGNRCAGECQTASLGQVA